MKNAFIMLLVGILFLSLITVFYPIQTCSAAGDTLHVGSGQTYSTIQAAINAANESGGDTVYVHGDTYDENVVIDRPLILTGEGSGTTTINGVDSNKHTIKIDVDDVSISGFTVQNSEGLDYASIFLNYVTNCTITNNIVSKGDNGIYIVGSSKNTISENTIEDNDANGISFSMSTNNEIYNNVIQNNDNNGIYLSLSSSFNKIYQNTIRNNNRYGQYLVSSPNNVIHHNDFVDNMEENAKDISTNTWDDGLEGNYWGDYTGEDNDGDGIGDVPYSISGGSNQDRYPLGYFQGEEPPTNEAPTADAGGPYSGRVNSEITFDASDSSDSDGNLVGYRWDWTNDGVYDTSWLVAATTSHAYSGAGTYTVKLQAKDNGGKTDVDTAQVTITDEDQKPTAEIITINPSETTYGTLVYFHGLGKDVQGIIIAYSWRSSIDDVISEQATFTKSNLSVGTHTIYFKVQDANGWSDEDSATLVINQDSSSPNTPPVADIGGPYTGHVNETITFDASDSYDPDEDNIVNYSWDFGDGAKGYGVTVDYTYTASGTYTVNLTIRDSRGEITTNVTTTSITLQSPSQNGDGSGTTGGTPGFELLLTFLAIALILLKKKKRG
jgi:parallel beta-helix repeat protein